MKLVGIVKYAKEETMIAEFGLTYGYNKKKTIGSRLSKIVKKIH